MATKHWDREYNDLAIKDIVVDTEINTLPDYDPQILLEYQAHD